MGLRSLMKFKGIEGIRSYNLMIETMKGNPRYISIIGGLAQHLYVVSSTNLQLMPCGPAFLVLHYLQGTEESLQSRVEPVVAGGGPLGVLLGGKGARGSLFVDERDLRIARGGLGL
jgi:hypothetical protein